MLAIVTATAATRYLLDFRAVENSLDFQALFAQ